MPGYEFHDSEEGPWKGEAQPGELWWAVTWANLRSEPKELAKARQSGPRVEP